MRKRITIALNARTAYFGNRLPDEMREKLDRWYSYPMRGYRWSKWYGMTRDDGTPVWDGRIRLLKNGQLPAGLFRATRKEIEKELHIKFEVYETPGVVKLCEADAKLAASDRKYQNECVSAMVNALTTGGGLIVAGTGAGKTRNAAMLFARIKGSVCFIVDELLLMEQARKELQDHLGEKVGIVGNQNFDPQRVTVATIQTLHRYRTSHEFRDWAKKVKVLMIDEVHIALNKRNVDVVQAFKSEAVFGLTATLELQKHEVRTKAYALCGPVIFSYPIATGVEQGYMSHGVVVQVRVPQSGVEKEYVKSVTELIVKGSRRNHLIVRVVKMALQAGKHVIVMVERRTHLERLSGMLDKIPHRLIWGDAKVSDRLQHAKEFEREKIKLILATRVLKKGVNIKRIDLMVDAAGMRSANDCVQKYGRGVRLCEGKSGLIYVDIGDKGNRFERAARDRCRAFKRNQIDVFQVPYEEGDECALKVLRRAERRLKKNAQASKQDDRKSRAKSQMQLPLE
ncbi:MAG: DEAD/DEAH box helicase family protein [Patescibacteria group bacterium]|nr:DEAD/DEAH box helicase family protein [Patescibacteria group bacterium]